MALTQRIHYNDDAVAAVADDSSDGDVMTW